MAWYLCLLIAVAVIALGALKLTVFKKIMAKKKAEGQAAEED